MPRRKSDATDDAAATPERDGTAEAASAEGSIEPTPALTEADLAAAGSAESPVLESPVPDASEAAIEGAAPPPEDRLDEHEEHHEEEPGPSLAARALLVLLLLIAGAALGIWGAPRLAPLLPSGMAPVAAWLTPGQADAEARIAALEQRLGSELDARLGPELDARFAALPGPEAVEAQVAAAVSTAQGQLEAEIGAVRDSVGQLDAGAIRQRLDRLDSGLDGQTAELAAIKDQLSGGAAAASALNDEAVQKIDVYSAELDGLRAEMTTLSDRVGALATRIDEVAAQADRQVQTAQERVAEIEANASSAVGAAAVDADVAQVSAALVAGAPYAAALERLAAADPSRPIPAALTAAAPTGVATLASLRDSFPDAAHAAIRASIMAGAGEGLFARSRAFLQAQTASRSLEPREGLAPDAVLSRIEARLKENDLNGALAQSSQLPSESVAAMQGWLTAARTRADAIAALETLQPSAPATN